MIETEPDPVATDAAAERLLVATRTAVPCPPIRDLIGPEDLWAAYAVQERLVESRVRHGAVVIGHKIGLTSPAVQAQLGVDQPDFGVLFDDMAYTGGDMVPPEAVMQPRAEAEIAFVLSSDLADGSLDLDQVRDAVSYAVAAIEICGSRIAGWDITFADTVADNASSGAFVLGPNRVPLDHFEPRDVTMTMTINGTTVSTGSGHACLGDPLAAVSWLARRLRDLGRPLHAGHLVLSGALGPMHDVSPGDHVRAEMSALGAVQFRVGEATA